MKITKSRLKQIIKEELSAVSEGLEDDIAAHRKSQGLETFLARVKERPSQLNLGV